MGYLKHKYTQEYFLKEDSNGNPINIGVEGAEEFKMGKGGIREHDADILKRINFKDKIVIEFGFGRGEAIKFAKDNGASRVVGVDFSQDACNIANEFFNRYGIKAEVYCDDALNFVSSYLANHKDEKFDIVLMLDFVEHVPRSELAKILNQLHNCLSNKAVIAINTPVFRVDNDVITEGLKTSARDTSDENEKTAGMHCNRYTKKSLESFMRKSGYQAISGHFFINGFLESGLIQGTSWAWKKALKTGYPILLSSKPEKFEYAYSMEDIRLGKSIFPLTLSQITKGLLKQMLPPIIYSMLRMIFLKKQNDQYQPTWHEIKDGPLKGREIFVDPKDGYWQKEVIKGNYDQFFFDYLNKLNLQGKIVFEIGAHIGYHAMSFAQMVGDSGCVYAFEPNIFNRERMELILTKNSDLAKRIKIYDSAISNIIGEVEFNFSPKIDNGQSSGSFISGSNTPYNAKTYENIGFKKVHVKTVTLDKLFLLGIDAVPHLIKIDVEGAENLVLQGGVGTLKRFKPIVLVEIHSVYNMLRVCELFNLVDYEIELLKEDNTSRCFIAASPLK